MLGMVPLDVPWLRGRRPAVPSVPSCDAQVVVGNCATSPGNRSARSNRGGDDERCRRPRPPSSNRAWRRRLPSRWRAWPANIVDHRRPVDLFDAACVAFGTRPNERGIAGCATVTARGRPHVKVAVAKMSRWLR